MTNISKTNIPAPVVKFSPHLKELKMLSKKINKTIERIDLRSTNADGRLAAEHLRARLEEEAHTNSCLRCDRATFSIMFSNVASAGIDDWSYYLAACSAQSAQAQAPERATLFFCSGEIDEEQPNEF